ncbi:MAG: HNH endonuclease [Elusimicrobia bacterium]|nr:HNH endonuclease [Elusimicrobiota bacterium]
MTEHFWQSCKGLEDKQLLFELKELARQQQRCSALFIACLGEADARDLLQKEGFSTTFDYCTRELKLSERDAFRNIRVARIARKYQQIYSLIADGSLTLCSVDILASHLKPDNVDRILDRAQGKSVRDVERLVAELSPKPDRPDLMRREAPASMIPSANGASPPRSSSESFPSAKPPRPDRLIFSAPTRVHFSFAADEELRNCVLRLKELLWHKFPAGRLEDIFLEIAKQYLNAHDPQAQLDNHNAPRRSNGSFHSRNVPKWIRKRVWRRDGGQCTFVSQEGRRCSERKGLQLDHVIPWANGGPSNDPENIRLLCWSHNQYISRAVFGFSAVSKAKIPP